MEEHTHNTADSYDKATFAGGCFWCMESAFRSMEGVIEAYPGYTGGEKEEPAYDEVSSGTTGHYEAIQIIYDPSKTTYDKLLEFYWKNVDPVDDGGQFVDRGPQYKTAIFYHNETQKELAEKSKEKLEKSGRFKKPIATRILPFKKFYMAEDYHQHYYEKSPIRYKLYEEASGRKKRLGEIWDD